MRPIERLLKHNLSFGGSGGFDQGPFWARPAMSWSPISTTEERIEDNFGGYVAHALKANGVVFACILARQMAFSEVRFQFQRLESGRPTDLFGTPALSLLESPWPNGTTGELLSRMEQDASLAGNFYATVVGEGADRRIRRLRPDWVTTLTGIPGVAADQVDPFALDAQLLGYVYKPDHPKSKATFLTPDRVVHYSPIPDPDAQWRGMSWITPVVREVQGHTAAARHKLKFFENGTTANFVVSYKDKLSPAQFQEVVQAYREAHSGAQNAYKTIHLGHGADITTVGADLKQLDFKSTQGSAETLIAAASGAGAIITQLSEGLAGSSLNQGNFNAARRRFADMTIRPLWRTAAASLAKFADVPGGSRLWYDARDVSFLQEDAKDAAEIEAVKAQTIRTLVDGGFEPASVIRAVDTQDMTLLVHTGKVSVQLTEPGSTQEVA